MKIVGNQKPDAVKGKNKDWEKQSQILKKLLEGGEMKWK